MDVPSERTCRPTCTTGKGGKASFKSPFTTNDGQWTVIRCARAATEVVLYIDGKLNCDNTTITCDYFAGEIDSVTIETS
ncbi:MAG: hypothetical protein WAN48_02730 [Actinomycetes bacterium]